MPNASNVGHVVSIRFDPREDPAKKGKQDTNHGDQDLILRLRASLRSAHMDDTSQSMRVSIHEEAGGRVIIDGSTEDYDERSVHLDTIELSSSKAYIIKYEFFEKNISIRSYEDKTVSGAHMGASSCSKPFVVQELTITAKELLVQRARKYKEARASTSSEAELGPKEHDLGELPKYCDFSILNNTIADMKDGERGLYCTRNAFTYSLVG